SHNVASRRATSSRRAYATRTRNCMVSIRLKERRRTTQHRIHLGGGRRVTLAHRGPKCPKRGCRVQALRQSLPERFKMRGRARRRNAFRALLQDVPEVLDERSHALRPLPAELPIARVVMGYDVEPDRGSRRLAE